MLYRKTDNHVVTNIQCSYNTNTDLIKINTLFHKTTGYISGIENNKNCPLWLGNKAEIVLMDMFEKVERMPVNNSGFDFFMWKRI